MINTLMIVRGPLGVGKTTISRILAERIGAKYISVDELLKEARLDRIDPKIGCIPLANFLAVQEDILPEIKKFLERQSVVIDGNFYHKEQIDFFTKIFKSSAVVVTLKASLDVCIDRDKKRKGSFGKKAVEEVHSLVSNFDYGLVVDTEGKSRDFIVEMIQKSARRK